MAATAPAASFAARTRGGIAIAAGRAAGILSRLSGHDATSIPGVVADRIDPSLLGSLAGRCEPTVVVIGANGKTTTTRLVASIIEHATGRRPVSNRSGANLVQGVLTALIAEPLRPQGRPAAVLEVDELAFSRVAADVQPDVVVILNLVRDQLDRFGEVDAVADRLTRDIAALPPTTQVVANADDPRIEPIARASRHPVLWFGLAKAVARETRAMEREPRSDAGPEAEHVPCPGCRQDLRPSTPTGFGPWQCSTCGQGRPTLDLVARTVGVDHDGWLRLAFDRAEPVSEGSAAEAIRVRLHGNAGASDAAAAVLTGIAIGLDPRTAISALDGATPAFGRLEELQVADRRVVLTLAKNPTSAAESAAAVEARRPDGLLIGLADRPADGRDVSWIWDASLDPLPELAPLTLTGLRAADLALRFKYRSHEGTGGAFGPPTVDPDVEPALDGALQRVAPGGTLMVLGTYTTLLAIRRVLQQRGVAPALPR
jgi:lipid II isoglutaminyl synthase (glutamine-hydrolysing)